MKMPSTPPPNGTLPILQKLIATYKVWHGYQPNISTTSRYTIGSKIDSLFLEIIELIFTANYSNKTKKISLVQKSSVELDSLKLFLQIFWEVKAINDKKYIVLSSQLNEVGKMIGGWLKQLKKNQARKITGLE